MSKILFVANIHKHFNAFHIPYIQYLQNLGHEVHVAANDPETRIIEADKQYDIDINRNPFSAKNIKAINQLKKIISKEGYNLVHCHTAMGSVVARLAAREFRNSGNLKIIYTAHGFHFYKDSPKLYWFLYYPMERYLSQFTDAIITINREDYELLSRKKFKNETSYLIPGIGINPQKFKGIKTSDKYRYRQEYGYDRDQFLILYVAEFTHRKNHKFILENIHRLKEDDFKFKFLFAGRGILRKETEALCKTLGVQDQVDFLGFRKDIGKFIAMSDIGISVSKHEGLPMNIAEEMHCGLPVIATDTRGHTDLIDHGTNGFLFRHGDSTSFIKYIKKLSGSAELLQQQAEAAKEKANSFVLSNSISEMSKIYKKYL